MRTLFTNAPFARFDLGRHILAQNGEKVTDPFLPQAQRDSVLLEIQAAQSKVKQLEDLIAWSADNDPGLKKYLGQDASRFFALSNSIAPLYGVVEMVLNRLSDPDPDYWLVADEDLAAVKQWTTGINQMYLIYQNHKTVPYTPTPGTKPPPTGSPTGPSVSPGGVLTKPNGLSTQDLLIGGAVAVGVGLLIAAIA